MRSHMPEKYLHYFGNESSEGLLEACGIISKDKQLSDILKTKQSPNCNEPNKPDSKFCAKCRMVLTYDAYSETLESQEQKQGEVDAMREELTDLQSSQREILDLLRSPKELMRLISEEEPTK